MWESFIQFPTFLLVGAGFASGQELLVFFVNFGAWGVAGTLVSAALFTFLGAAS